MKKIFLALSICLISQVLVAQVAQGIHLNLFFGMSNYSGDLQEKRFTFSQSHLAGGVGLSYDVLKQLSIRASFKMGKVSAEDSKGRNKARNLSFFTNISDVSLDAQYFLSPMGQHPLTPYIFLGLTVYHFNPYTFDSTGKKFYLHPLSTEGEGFVPGRKEYKLTQLAIPVGAGVKLSLTDNINVGFEIGLRRLFTDYLDDVSSSFVDPNLLRLNRGQKAVELSYRGDEVKGGSPNYPPVGFQRGNPIYKDWYYFAGLTLSYKLRNNLFNKSDDGARKRKKGKLRQWDCPGRVL